MNTKAKKKVITTTTKTETTRKFSLCPQELVCLLKEKYGAVWDVSFKLYYETFDGVELSITTTKTAHAEEPIPAPKERQA